MDAGVVSHEIPCLMVPTLIVIDISSLGFAGNGHASPRQQELQALRSGGPTFECFSMRCCKSLNDLDAVRDKVGFNL